MNKISIIVPVYNTSKFLKKCIDSLINQTLKEIEIIILNDGSTDNSDEIIRSYNDIRIKYINKNNEGIAITRNIGINLSKGEYITFVDSDDFIDSTFCEKMYSKAKNDKCDIVVCDYYNCTNSENSKISLISFKNTTLKGNPDIINKINLGPCNKIYSSDLIKNNRILFPENIKYEDVPFVCECLVKANCIGKIDDALSFFNIREGSQTTIRDEKIFDIFKVTDLIKKVLINSIPNFNLEYLILSIIINYLVQNRYIKNYKIRKKHINLFYNYLNKNLPEWKSNEYFNNINYFKAFVIKNKFLLSIYCNIYTLFI